MKIIVLILLFIPFIILAQEKTEINETLESLKKDNENLRHRLDKLEKGIDDIYWYHKIGDVAHIDKVYMYGPPKWKEKNPTAMETRPDRRIPSGRSQCPHYIFRM